MKYTKYLSLSVLATLLNTSCELDYKTFPVSNNDETVEIQVGSRTLTTDKFTEDNKPVVPMWGENIPSDPVDFPVLTNAEHTVVWQPQSEAEGAYNHYACLINYKGKFYGMWGNHPLGEDGPGQRILFATSDSWGQWSAMRELFAAPGPIEEREEEGIHLKADRWAIVDDKLFAIVYVFEAGRYPIVRQVNENGLLGRPFLLDELSSGDELPSYMKNYTQDQLITPLSSKLRDWYDENDEISWWASAEMGVQREGNDGSRLIECFMYRADDGIKVLMMRNWGTPSNPIHNNRMYVSFKDEDGSWGLPYPSDIPDSPSRAQAIKLEDGRILLIGNQITTEFDNALYLDRNPMTISVSEDGYIFDKAYTLREGTSNFRFSGIGGRNKGFAYSSSIVHDGWLYTFYSVRKEDMEITRVPIADIGQ